MIVVAVEGSVDTGTLEKCAGAGGLEIDKERFIPFASLGKVEFDDAALFITIPDADALERLGGLFATGLEVQARFSALGAFPEAECRSLEFGLSLEGFLDRWNELDRRWLLEVASPPRESEGGGMGCWNGVLEWGAM